MREPGVRYALAPGGAVADPKAAPKLERVYLCLDCKEHVHVRRGEVRKPYFAHYAARPRPCSAETVAHEAAKHKLVGLLLSGARSLELRLACRGYADVLGDARACPDDARLERSLEVPDFDRAGVEVAFGPYRLDAAASSAGRVVLGLEVYQSHLVDPPKRAALTASGLPWAELYAEEVLEKSMPWAVVTSSFGALQCGGCAGREASARAERARRESAEKAARANAEALRQRQNGQVHAPTASGGESVDRVRCKANKLGRNRRQIEKAACFARGYLVLAFVLIPALAKGASTQLRELTEMTIRVLTYAGTATIFFGVILVTRTRGFGSLLSGEWGGIIIACLVIAVALLGTGDGALRPALRRVGETQDVRPAQRLALLGFGLSVVAVGLMTRALYVPT